ncbi:MAG TPA: PqqD family protein, partial [Gemmatimonadales bacterium]|nr:PqqD family protein [Gemmatimonadales bacterium]
PRVRADVVFRQLDDQWVVYDPSRDRLHALNLTAALVWTHCTGEHTAQVIAEVVGSSFTPPRPGREILPDILASLDRFRAEGLLE